MNIDDKASEAWLREWETISSRIAEIDARLWQGAGIMLTISLGGISLVGWRPPNHLGDVIFITSGGVVAAIILLIWWYMFHRWIHLQRVYSFRAREIEVALNLWFNRYVRLIERWHSEEDERKKLNEKCPEVYSQLSKFWEKEHRRRHYTHVTIQTSLRWLTIVLWSTWALFVIFYWVAYLLPSLLGL